MTQDQLIDKILADLYMNSNRGMNYYDDFSVYENDINKLEEAKTVMEKEGLITNYKNLKTGISPLGFKICFEGGYLEDKIKKERHIKNMLKKNKVEITYLRKELRSKNKTITFLLILLICFISFGVLMTLGIIDFSI